MGRDLKRELAQLKREYIAFERAMQEEKESLGRIINTLCVLAAKEEALSEEIDAIKSLVNSPEPLQLEKAEEITSSLKDKILAAVRRPDDVFQFYQQRSFFGPGYQGKISEPDSRFMV